MGLPEVLRNHIDYTVWATQRLLGIGSELSDEELVRDFSTADRSVLGTLVHTFRGERIWLQRIMHGTPQIPFALPNDENWRNLNDEWPLLHDKWVKLASEISDQGTERASAGRDPAPPRKRETSADLGAGRESVALRSFSEVIAYPDLKGAPRAEPLWQIVLHVVNHSTHHRGQVSGFLRSMGKHPPALDFIVFMRARASAQPGLLGVVRG